MKKILLTLCVCLTAFSSAVAQSVYVYRNDGTPVEKYEAVKQMKCSQLDADQVPQSHYVTQEIETSDAVARIPLEAIDSVRFHAPSIPASFPKKHLIEEFTGQSCGYCPYGMDCISSFMKGDDNWILVLHHYGYAPDKFSVSGSQTITNSLGVDGAPSVCVDRDMTQTEAGNSIVFHPAYMTSLDKSQFETTTYASVQIENDYNAETRELKVKVSGDLCRDDYPTLQLTVLVKESGMIESQQDYYNTYEGWEQFRHANAVRVFLSSAKGDKVTVDAVRHYTATYTTTLKSSWVPENCMVVAFLSEAFKPVVQAEEQPVVAGTSGGSDLEHGGITAVAVPDYYPEPDATSGPGTYSSNSVETMTTSRAYYEDYTEDEVRFWEIETYNPSSYVTVSRTKSVPYARIYVLTPINETQIPAGEYPINTSAAVGTVYAGFRDDSRSLIDGSQFYFLNYSYFTQGYMVPTAQWLIADGTFKVSKNGTWTLDGHAQNGSEIHLKGTSSIVNGGPMNAPARNKVQVIAY
ncbi:MAG: Omp28-related outer membrane protein [Paludibacteraceae bacterium]|nr:Omp28-related outer membrane protein [Paludibacteraceae bacterium]